MAPSSVPRLHHIEVISFDLDDTLWDCAPVIAQAEAEMYGWMQVCTPRITASHSLQEIRQQREAFAATHPEYRVDVTFLRKESLRVLFAEFDYPDELVHEAFAVFYHARSRVDLYADATKVLSALKSHYKLAALTNGNADLALIGIDHLFDDIQLASVSNPPKPAVTMFTRSAEALGCDTRQMLHIGDNPGTDVEGGRNAGAMTVWFNQHATEWPHHLQPPDLEINRLTALPELLPRCR